MDLPDMSEPIHHFYAYKTRSRYAEQLERWLAHFPIGHFFIESSEAFNADRDGTLARVCGFLGIGPARRTGFPVFKQGSYSPIDRELRSTLQQTFKNEHVKLNAILDRAFPWNNVPIEGQRRIT